MMNFSLLLGSLFFSLGWLFAAHTYKVIAVIALMSILPLFNVVKTVYLASSERNMEDVDIRSALEDGGSVLCCRLARISTSLSCLWKFHKNI